MKLYLFFTCIFLLMVQPVFSQLQQIGMDINGEAAGD